MLRRLVKRLSQIGDGPRPGSPPVGDAARGTVVSYFGDEAHAGTSKQ